MSDTAYKVSLMQESSIAKPSMTDGQMDIKSIHADGIVTLKLSPGQGSIHSLINDNSDAITYSPKNTETTSNIPKSKLQGLISALSKILK